MRDEIGPSDRFRSFENLERRDRRQWAYVVTDANTGERRERTLRDHYDAIAILELGPNVPTEIRIHFDTARHLLVHSWYVYRFIQVAEAHALGAVEMALRQRLGVGERSRSSLKPLLRRAVAQGVLADSGLRHLWRRGDPPDPGRAGMSDAALRLEAEGRDRSNEYMKILLEALPGYRNELAHGSAMLAPGGRVVLSICRDVIDQLFAAADGEPSESGPSPSETIGGP